MIPFWLRRYIDRGLVHPLDDSILVKGVYRQGPGAPTG